MGVKDLHKWLKSSVKSAHKGRSKNKKDMARVFAAGVDHVLVDMNCLLHETHHAVKKRTQKKPPTQQESFFYRQMVGSIQWKLDEIIKQLRPRKSLFIAVDGAAPLGKLFEQRDRRKLTEEVVEDAGIRSDSPLERSALTPGTALMRHLHIALKKYAARAVAGAKEKSNGTPHLDVIVSSCDVPGEGELKILEYLASAIREPSSMQTVSGFRWKTLPTVDDVTVVVGADSDLFVQMLGLTEYSSLYVVGDEILRIDEARVLLSKSMAARDPSRHVKKSSIQLDEARLVADFICMCTMVGNDYLRKLGHLSPASALEAYAKVRKESFSWAEATPAGSKLPSGASALLNVSKRTFNWKFFFSFLQNFKGSSRRELPTRERLQLDNFRSRVSTYKAMKVREGQAEQAKLAQMTQIHVENDGEGSEFEVQTNKSDTESEESEILEDVLSTEDEEDDDDDVSIISGRIRSVKEMAETVEVEPALLEMFRKEAELFASVYPDDPSKMCNVVQYLNGVLWCTFMYVDGCCVDPYFMYCAPFSPPVAMVLEWISNSQQDAFLEIYSPDPAMSYKRGLCAYAAGLLCVPAPMRKNALPDIVASIADRIDLDTFTSKEQIYRSGTVSLVPMLDAFAQLNRSTEDIVYDFLFPRDPRLFTVNSGTIGMSVRDVTANVRMDSFRCMRRMIGDVQQATAQKREGSQLPRLARADVAQARNPQRFSQQDRSRGSLGAQGSKVGHSDQASRGGQGRRGGRSGRGEGGHVRQSNDRDSMRLAGSDASESKPNMFVASKFLDSLADQAKQKEGSGAAPRADVGKPKGARSQQSARAEDAHAGNSGLVSQRDGEEAGRDARSCEAGCAGQTDREGHRLRGERRRGKRTSHRTDPGSNVLASSATSDAVPEFSQVTNRLHSQRDQTERKAGFGTSEPGGLPISGSGAEVDESCTRRKTSFLGLLGTP